MNSSRSARAVVGNSSSLSETIGSELADLPADIKARVQAVVRQHDSPAANSGPQMCPIPVDLSACGEGLFEVPAECDPVAANMGAQVLTRVGRALARDITFDEAGSQREVAFAIAVLMDLAVALSEAVERGGAK